MDDMEVDRASVLADLDQRFAAENRDLQYLVYLAQNMLEESSSTVVWALLGNLIMKNKTSSNISAVGMASLMSAAIIALAQKENGNG